MDTNLFLRHVSSYQSNTWSSISKELSYKDILNEICSEEHCPRITVLRQKLKAGDKEFYDSHKLLLPAVTFSATFDKKRLANCLKQYNPVLVIDIDKLNESQIDDVYNKLLNEAYVFCFWRSPSNNGFKGLVSLAYSNELSEEDYYLYHKSAFAQLSEYFLKTHEIELDKSGSDITRLCFLSYDPDLILKEQVFSYNVETIKSTNETRIDKRPAFVRYSTSKDALYNPMNKNDQKNRIVMSEIIKYLTHKKLSITHRYEEWCRVAMAIANSFTFEIGLKYFLKLCAIDKDKFDEIECSNLLTNCYEHRRGDINFNSIVYFANQKGYKTKAQKNGVLKAEEETLSQVSLSSKKS